MAGNDLLDIQIIVKRLMEALEYPARVAVFIDKASKGCAKAISKDFQISLNQNLSVSDSHSAIVLHGIGHPYSIRHGTSLSDISIHQDKPWVVHTRSGAMKNAWNPEKKFVQPSGFIGLRNQATYKITAGFDSGKNAEGFHHAEHVIQGTPFPNTCPICGTGREAQMIRRPVVAGTFLEYAPRIGKVVRQHFNARELQGTLRIGSRF